MTASAQIIEDLTPPKWLVVLQGIAGVVLGLLLIVAPGASSLIIVQFLGIYWLISGIIGLVSLIWDRSQWGWKVLAGLIGILAGMAIVQHPLWSTVLVGTTLVAFMGAIAIAYGTVALIRGLSGGGWGIVVLGVFDVIIGLMLLFDPLAGAIALPIVIGVLILVGGIGSLVVAYRLERG